MFPLVVIKTRRVCQNLKNVLGLDEPDTHSRSPLVVPVDFDID